MLCLNSVPVAPGVRSALALACVLTLTCADVAWSQQQGGAAIEPVVISASRMPQLLQTAAIGATVITAEHMARAGVADANEAIRKLGGVAATSDLSNGREQVLDLRGFGATASQNLVVLIDGIRVSENEIASARLTAIPLDLIDRIEIVRGGASVLWGEGATAGVINVILKQPAGDASSARLSMAAESHAGHEVAAAGHLGLGKAVLDASLKRVRSDGYREHSGYKQDVSAVGVQWADAGWQAGLRVVHEDQRAQLPGSLRLVQFQQNPRTSNTRADFSNLQETRYLAKLARASGPWGWQVDAGYRLRRPEYQYVSLGSDRVQGRSSQRQITPRMTYATALLAGDVKAMLGLDWQAWLFEKTGPTGLETGSQYNGAAFVHADISWPSRTRMSVGWREEQVRKQGDYPGNPAWFAAPALYERRDKLHAAEWGLSQTLATGWDLYGRVASSYRLANVDENRVTPGMGALLPQRNKDLELGLKWRMGPHDATVRRFQQDAVNEIVYVGGDVQANANIEPTRRQGVEVEGHWRPLPGLTVMGTWQQLSARYRAGPHAGKEMTQVAPHTATARLSWRLLAQHTLELGVQHRAQARLAGDEDNACDKRLPSVTLFDARYAWSDRVWTVALGASNLGDEKGYNYGYSYECGAPSVYPYAGRSVKLSVARQF